MYIAIDDVIPKLYVTKSLFKIKGNGQKCCHIATVELSISVTHSWAQLTNNVASANR